VNDLTALVDRMRAAAGAGDQPGQPDRERVKQIAAQFESMLLVQMLREMRESGKWEDESPEAEGLGADSFFDTLDVELAGFLSRAKGFGLAEELLGAMEKAAGADGTPTTDAAISTIGTVPGTLNRESGTPGPDTNQVVQATTGALSFAVPAGSITSSYGWRRDPFTGQAKFHKGIDVRAAYGQDIQSAGAGRVVFSGDQKGYGTTVVVEHGNGVRTRYAHLSAAVVQEGQTVGAGQVLGRAGNSGRATGTHLHFEVLKDGRPVSPEEAGLAEPKSAH
jgi:murein DD-endopeptidase MepM/ murein hydrolase activator NlpD